MRERERKRERMKRKCVCVCVCGVDFCNLFETFLFFEIGTSVSEPFLDHLGYDDSLHSVFEWIRFSAPTQRVPSDVSHSNTIDQTSVFQMTFFGPKGNFYFHFHVQTRLSERERESKREKRERERERERE